MKNPYKNHILKDFYRIAIKEISHSVREETMLEKIRRVENHILPYIGDIKIVELTPLQLEQWQIRLSKSKGVDQARRCKSILKSILNRAIFHNIIKDNPISIITQLRGHKIKQREVYTKEEIETMLHNSDGLTHLIILTMVSLGVRSGEVIALKFSDINWVSRTIKVQRAIRNGKIKATKTGVDRLVDIPQSLFYKLVAHHRNTNYSMGYIFTNTRGTYYKESSSFLRRHFKPLLERLEIDYKGMYSFRATYATLSLYGGQSITYIAKQLGHTDIRTTEQYYIKYYRSDRDLQRADTILSF